ncbi:MAG TPA: prenyltransferase/squalene oxidase repeat-containing protein [Solirubrobacteraceae bacterium]|jgi:energy-coupling factor transport system substrate-specific component|nr:prenyltransferase/squalene oxidase repeat-containing protein [Solirubrobacteraceae bacterium]
MSWLLASSLIVALILFAGWIAYERRRPSARMVAVVATLAAVAALGRDAFVALPDVKPITAIAFVVGYALGPLPGFTVGAIGMLASNIMLGQGPYTPWQMAAWGLVGLAGAALGALTHRRIGRVPLALACAIAALIAKEIMNLYTFTLAGAHTPAAFLAIAGTSLPFDVTDVFATLLFALAFGPELARLLARTRERMTVSWEPHPPPPVGPAASAVGSSKPGLPGGGVAAATVLVIVVVSLGLGGLVARPRTAGAVTVDAHAASSFSPELSFLASAQNSDGGFGGARGQGSSELYTAWSAMGLAAAGRNPASVRRSGHSVLDSLHAQVSTLQGLGDAERTILAARACGASAYSFAGRNLVAEVLRSRERDDSFDHQVNLTAFAIFALRAVGHSPGLSAIHRAAGWIERQQNPDGGFSFGAHGAASDVDDTGAALQALADAGARNRGVFGAAASYLMRSQNLDGGFPQQYGGESNAQSTAWAIQGLIAAGYGPGAVRRRGSRSPLGFLESLRAPDGSIRYSRTGAQTPVWVTAQALIALAGRTFPVGP